MSYKEKYLNYFGIHPIDFVYDEYEFIVNERQVKAVNIHHVEFGAHKTDDIENLMALSYHNHTAAHNEEIDRYELKEIHKQFMENNPY